MLAICKKGKLHKIAVNMLLEKGELSKAFLYADEVDIPEVWRTIMIVLTSAEIVGKAQAAVYRGN